MATRDPATSGDAQTRNALAYDVSEIEEYPEFGSQDPNEPVWESDAVIAAMGSVRNINDEYGGAPEYCAEGSGGYQDNEPMRLNSGALDFVNDIVTEVADFLTVDDPIPGGSKLPPPIEVRDKGADKWRGRNATLAAQTSSPVLVNSIFRREVTLVNYGPNDAYITSSPLTQIIPAAGPIPPNVFVLKASFQGATPVYAPMVITTKDDVWAYCAQTQAATIGIIEEFDNRR